MDGTERDKMLFSWLNSEHELVNKQISAWSEADQKLIAVMATIAVGIIGLSSARILIESGVAPSYMLMLASVLMSLAVIQSSLYSSLILLAMERKMDLNVKLGAFLAADADFALCVKIPPVSKPFISYKIGLVAYLAFRCSFGLILSFAALFYSSGSGYDYKLVICLVFSFIFSSTAAFVTIHHAFAFLRFFEGVEQRS